MRTLKHFTRILREEQLAIAVASALIVAKGDALCAKAYLSAVLGDDKSREDALDVLSVASKEVLNI
jgi:hypothetical protein